MNEQNSSKYQQLEQQQKEDKDNEVKIGTTVAALESKNARLETQMKMLETEKQQLTQKLASVEEQYKKEIVELKVKLTNQNETFEKKLKALEETMQMNQQNFGKNENQFRLPTRQMKIQLPLENWHDLLGSVPRNQLGNVVSQIGDRQFAHIIQSFLHGNAEITLGAMCVIRPRRSVSSDRPMVKVWPHTATHVPDWPMPGNVKNFKEIYLEYLDISVLNFLGEFQENSLLENVNLKFCNLEEVILLRALTQILPVISSIDSIDSLDVNLFNKVYKDDSNGNGSEWPSQLLMLKTMMEKTRILYLRYNECAREDKIDWFCRWLYGPRNDGKPRKLNGTYFSELAHCYSFLERIIKDFERANISVSFFILLRIRIGGNGNLRGTSFSGENVETDEKLVIKVKELNEWWITLMISRHPLKAAKQWIEANEEEILKWNTNKLNRRIILDNGLAIEM